MQIQQGPPTLDILSKSTSPSGWRLINLLRLASKTCLQFLWCSPSQASSSTEQQNETSHLLESVSLPTCLPGCPACLLVTSSLFSMAQLGSHFLQSQGIHLVSPHTVVFLIQPFWTSALSGGLLVSPSLPYGRAPDCGRHSARVWKAKSTWSVLGAGKTQGARGDV